MTEKVIEINETGIDEKSFWYADWAFPIMTGLMAAAVFAGTSMYVEHGTGAFNEVAFVAMLKAGLTGGSYGPAAAFGASFLFARVLEGSLVGILDLGGSILTGVGLGIPAILLAAKIDAPVKNFWLALPTGLLIGLIIGAVIIGIRRATIKGKAGAQSTFGADIMMGAGNSTGRFLGPLIILSAGLASIPVGIGSVVGALIFYLWKKPITGGAILGAMIMGAFFPVVLK